MTAGELPRAGARSDGESKSFKQTNSRVSLGQQEQLEESSTWLGGKECHCLCWCCLERSSVPLEVLRAPLTRWSLAGDCALHQTGNAKAAAGREELVSPIGAKREDLGHLFYLPGSAQPLSIMMPWQSPSQS